MAEDFAESEDLTEKEKAALRWQAVQGFNAAPVPPLAARLGIALICHMDARENSPAARSRSIGGTYENIPSKQGRNLAATASRP